MSHKHRLTQNNRIKSTAHYQCTYSNGRKFDSRFVVLWSSPKLYEKGRVGFVASRKVGNAVRRNRCKRLIKEIFRRQQHDFDLTYDYIWIVKRTMNHATYQEIEESIFNLQKKINR